MSETVKHEFKQGLKGGVPIGLGYLSVSFAFGIMASNGGLSILQTVLISMTNLTSAGQLAGTQLLFECATYLEIAVTTLVINLRYLLMSLSMAQKTDSSMTTMHRFFVSFGITDEIFAVSAQRRGAITPPYMYGLIIIPYIGWALGTFLGAAASFLLPSLVRNALGIAIYGMFIAIVIPPIKRESACRMVVVVAVALSCLLHWAPHLREVPDGWAMIICAVAASAIGAILFPREEAGT